MFSPYKLISEDANHLEIGSNFELAARLQEYFKDNSTDYLWNIATARQRMAPALKDTKMIALRKPVTTDNLTQTMEWNQVTTIVDDILMYKIPIFKETFKWLNDTMKSLGASDIEWGRMFFSKHLAKTQVGLHTDEGAYFNYFDRFHFVVDSNADNIFYIRDEPIVLEVGKVYWVNNHVPHWLENKSSNDRINLIFDTRLI